MGLSAVTLVGAALAPITTPMVLLAGAAAWGAGVLLTPPPKQPQQKALGPGSSASAKPPRRYVPAPVLLEEKLTAVAKNLRRAAPPQPVLDRMYELDTTLRFVLSEWDHIDSTPEHQQTVWNIIDIYLPEVVNTYIDAPQYQSAEAVAVVTDSLQTLTGAARRVKDGILDDNLRAMDSQARMLRETFGNLPGLDTGYQQGATDGTENGRHP
ncbi:hypothetical protein KIP68_01290 [Corynebacterium aquatimens]|nr:hypothetical protein [Corynebacterium aquatimens]